MVFGDRDTQKDFYKTFLSIPSTYWSHGDAIYVPILLVNQGCRVQFNKSPDKKFLELKLFNNNSRIEL